uniref:Ig-like domain-containing protein n=1 Tax=Chelydra serpentina TaxID=8475 RepID=A0A8C3SP68_CHESE
VSPPLTAGLFVNPEGSYPKPSISVSTNEVIPVGGNVTIRCRHQRLGMRFLLYKDGDWNYLTYTDPAGSEAEFPIPSARREHGGSYTCRYSNRTGPAAYSEPSDPVQIIVAAGREYPKPTIWVSPSRVVALRGSVTIRCEGRYRSMEFFLRKAGHPNPQVQTVPDGTVAEFPIPSVSREDGGSYICEYHSIADQNLWSHPSDPVKIIVAGEGPGSVSRLPAPHPARPSGGLCTDGMLRARLCPEPWTIAPCSGVGGSCLLCADPSLPRPSISLSPTGVTVPGADVTIQCQGQRRDVRFFLHKAGDLNPQRHMDPAGDGAEFRIPTVGREHGGSYSCSYRPRSEPFVSSLPSDPVQLVVAGEGPGSASPLPAPHSAGPWGMVGINGTVKARLCLEPSRVDAWLGSRDRVIEGSSHWRFESEGGGIPAPRGSCRAGGLSQGDAPYLGGRTEGLGPRGCSAGPSPLPWTPSTQWGAVLGRSRWLGRRVGSSPPGVCVSRPVSFCSQSPLCPSPPSPSTPAGGSPWGEPPPSAAGLGPRTPPSFSTKAEASGGARPPRGTWPSSPWPAPDGKTPGATAAPITPRGSRSPCPTPVTPRGWW